MKLFKSKKVVAVAATAGLLLGVGGAAFAYFTATGNGTGSASVGSASDWKVTVNSDATNTLFPGHGSETVAYSVQNVGSGNQELNSVTVSVADDGFGNVLDHGTPVVGCLSADFTATDNGSTNGVTPGGPSADLAPTATDNGTITITMQDSGVPQDACQGIGGPDITLDAA